jgi:hypothetical protein
LTFEIIDLALIGACVAALIFFGILLSLKLGRWLGRRDDGGDAAAHRGIGSLEGTVFALLGLLVAFTFAGALARFDVRRAQAVDEANAIDTAWMRVDVLPLEAQPKLRESFRRYVDSRIATDRKLPNVAEARQELERSQQLQGEIWARAVAATSMPGVRPGADLVLLPALNQMFDITTIRVTATQMHPPLIIYVMLTGFALVAALLAGYQTAAEEERDRIHRVGFATIMAFTVYVILDLEYPRLGFVRIDAIDKVLMDVRDGMK